VLNRLFGDEGQLSTALLKLFNILGVNPIFSPKSPQGSTSEYPSGFTASGLSDKVESAHEPLRVHRDHCQPRCSKMDSFDLYERRATFSKGKIL